MPTSKLFGKYIHPENLPKETCAIWFVDRGYWKPALYIESGHKYFYVILSEKPFRIHKFKKTSMLHPRDTKSQLLQAKHPYRMRLRSQDKPVDLVYYLRASYVYGGKGSIKARQKIEQAMKDKGLEIPTEEELNIDSWYSELFKLSSDNQYKARAL